MTGERFQDIIGTISLGSEMKSAMQEVEEEEEEEPTPAASTSTTPSNGSASSSTTVSTSSTKPAKPALSPEQQAIADKKKAQKEEQERKLAEEKAKVREQRVKALSVKLRDKLALFSEQAVGEEDKQIADGGEFARILLNVFALTDVSTSRRDTVRTMWSIEAEELKKESYGVELLHTVGFVYQSKSKSVALPF